MHRDSAHRDRVPVPKADSTPGAQVVPAPLPAPSPTPPGAPTPARPPAVWVPPSTLAPKRLRDTFVEFLELRGYRRPTMKSYVHVVKKFAEFIKCPPARMTRQHIHDFLLYLKRDKKLEHRTINLHYYGIKAFVEFLLPDASAAILQGFRRMREPHKQPLILSREEVERVIAAAENLKRKAFISLMYSSGIRLSECVNLTLKDIHRDRKVLFIRQGKGGRDRYALLSDRALRIAEDYYRAYKPQTYLFEGKTPGQPMRHRSVENMVALTGFQAGLGRRISAHMLRHSFATHSLEAGVPLQVIQQLLGHAQIGTTVMYTHVSAEMLHSAKSPFDTPLAQQPVVTPVVLPEPKPRRRPTRRARHNSRTSPVRKASARTKAATRKSSNRKSAITRKARGRA